jgi:uncharacterized protein
MMTHPFALLIFTREPVPGRTKTRLIPAHGAAGAAQIHTQLLLRTLRTGLDATKTVVVYAADTLSTPYFSQLKTHLPFTLKQQTGADLGARMAQALLHELRTHERVLLVGADCAVHSAEGLQAAAHALGSHDMVFTPAEDGGYVLVGARRAAASRLGAAFGGVSWGTAQVMAQTRERLAAAALSHAEMPTLWDIDEPADVERALAAGLLSLLN